MENKNYEKQLPDVFKELNEIRKRQAVLNTQQIPQKNIQKAAIKKNTVKKTKKINTEKDDFNYDIYQRYQNYRKSEIVINHKFNAIGAILGILIFILFMTTIKSNYIFATSRDEEKKVIGTFEENSNPINLMECVSENISEIVKKEITTEEVIVEREIEYIENNQLPRNEQVVIEEGRDEHREVTYVRSYENEELINETVISDILKQDSIKSVIHVGTSDFLFNNKVHIGDTMYTKKEIYLMNEPKEDSEVIGIIYQYIDLTLKEVQNEWCKITVDGLEGYVESDLITSAAITPDIVEKNRIKRVMLNLNFDMNINTKSGLKREDFVKIFTGNINDVYSIFENNAGLFYDIEQKYNINGIFLAAIGIHESNWGNSNIAKDKKNLFGYGAYDSSPYESAITFESYEFGIELLAEALTKYYVNAPGTIIYNGEAAIGSYYNGPTISGVNVRYASDQNWSNKVYQIMLGLYEKLEN